MTTFLYGIIFAVVEQVTKSFASLIGDFRPHRWLLELCKDMPAFFSFAFIAGVGADWISDRQKNHSLPFALAILIWVLCLVLRHILWSEWQPLKRLCKNGKTKTHASLVLVVSLVSSLVVAYEYFYWALDVNLDRSIVITSDCVAVGLYVILVILYLSTFREQYKAQCHDYVDRIIGIICNRLGTSYPSPINTPDAFIKIPKNSIKGLSLVMEQVLNDGNLVVSLEDTLTADLSTLNILPHGEIRLLVRAKLKLMGEKLQAEYYAYDFVISSDANAVAKARDILKNGPYAPNLPVLEQIRNNMK